MQIINPIWKAAHQSTDPLRARAKKRRWVKDKVAGHCYLEGTHRYKLCGNQKDLGEEMVTTGRQAKAQNEVLLEIYREDIRAEIDAGVKFGQTVSALKRWVIVERHVAPE